VDPLAEKMTESSPFSYGFCNPIRFSDFHGLIPWDEVVKYTSNNSDFGLRFHPLQKTWKGHTGIDLGVAIGSEVKTLASGKIVHIGWNERVTEKGVKEGYGRYVVIEHGDGYYSLYGHLQKDGVMYNIGKELSNGEVFALSGNTGGSTGPHLHLEIIKAEELFGPNGIFNKENKIDPKSIDDLHLLLNPPKTVDFEIKFLPPNWPIDNVSVFLHNLQQWVEKIQNP